MSTQLAMLVVNLKTFQELDKMGQNVLQMLAKDGHKAIRRVPSVLVLMIGKSSVLIESTYYLKIIKVMADAYKKSQDNFSYGLSLNLDDQLLISYPDRFFSLLQILVNAGFLSRTECFRIIVGNCKHIAWNNHQSVEFTDELLDTLRILLEEGADPSIHVKQKPYHYTSEKSVGYKLFQNIFHILAENGRLFRKVLGLIPLLLSRTEDGQTGNEKEETALHAVVDCDWSNFKLYKDVTIETTEQYKQIVSKVVELDPEAVNSTNSNTSYPLQLFLCRIERRGDVFAHLNDIVAMLRSETSIDEQDKQGCTALHYLSKLFPLNGLQDVSENVHENFLDLIKQVKSTKNIDIQNENGRTALHILVMKLFLNPELGFDIQPILELLATEGNVNALDRDSVTPYTWICLGKEVHEKDKIEGQGIFSMLEKIFARNGANSAIAKAALVPALLLWIQKELSNLCCTLERLEKLLNYINSFKDSFSGYHLNCKMVSDMFLNAFQTKNPKYVDKIIDIIQAMLATFQKTDIPYFLTTQTLHSHCYSTSLGMEVLYRCMITGVQLAQDDFQALVNLKGLFTLHGEHNERFVKILIAFCGSGRIAQDWLKENDMLDFLGDCFIISEELQQLARQLVHLLYGKLDKCLESDHLLNCLLFLSHELTNTVRLDEKLFNKPLVKNAFNRSPLHLAVIFLHNELALKSLPNSVLRKYLNAKDIHGCTPLHLAHLHHNEEAVGFLLEHDACKEAIDNFGMSPADLGSHVGVVSKNDVSQKVQCNADVEYYQRCCNVMSADCEVLKHIRPMLVVLEHEAENTSKEMKLLFERLLKGTKFYQTEVLIAGSVREKLKAGRPDEVDIQIQFKGASSVANHTFMNVCVIDLKKDIVTCLQSRIDQISWEGINLRPISFTWLNPWKFMQEGKGLHSGTVISVDIVTVFLHGVEEDKHYEQHLEEILVGAPAHYKRSYIASTLKKRGGGAEETTFALEWNILDSLPIRYRLAFVMAKALVQAYEWSEGDEKGVKMPITSYMLKTALFFILAGNSDVQRISEALRYSLGSSNDDASRPTSNFTDAGFTKLKFDPNPKWTTDEDVDQYAEDARIIARQIFRFIRHLSQQGCQMLSYWKEPRVGQPSRHFAVVEGAYITDICDRLLERLERHRFYESDCLSVTAKD